MFTYVIDVGFTTVRPVQPDQYYSQVLVMADTDAQAQLIAAQMVSCRPTVVMATSTEIVSVEL